MKNHKVAVIGVACRFPGGINSLDDYWEVLSNEIDAVSEIPTTRWSKEIYGHPHKSTKGRSYVWSAGILNDLDKFDAAFFGISRREAEQIDPQQRLLLELTWEALESGGLKASQLAGSRSGVFIGVGSNDYALRRVDDLSSMNAYSMTGNTASVCSNRISYVFDLHGPSFSVDTACSSSLVALHQACSSIQNGESELAIVGGVNMLLHPMGFVGFSQASMLSPSGRCRAFDAAGDGYVRAEGAAIVILKSLAQAELDGDHIWAIIDGTAINNDGKTNGISVPSSDAQTQLLSEIYDSLEIDVDQLAYIEAHGTGTPVGDPLEANAISRALASKRHPGNPLLIGSAKTNLGHLEVASGMAGLLKAILCLQHRAIPASLHFKNGNPNIPFADWNLKVVVSYTPLNSASSLLIGVNSFGFGGSNAHVLLEEYRPTESVKAQTSLSVQEVEALPPLYLSARSIPALQSLAKAYSALIDANIHNYYDIAWSAFTQRQFLEQRIVAHGSSSEQISEQLKEFAAGNQCTNIVLATQLTKKVRVALAYSGNGSQWQGMGCTLYQENQVFRDAVLEVSQYWEELAGYSLVDELMASKESSKLALTEVAQPTLFALQVAITKVLLVQGLKAEAAFGHSVGEIAAAWAAGALSLKQAVTVIYQRSYAQSLTKGSGKMAAVVLSATLTNEWLAKLNLQDQIVIAATNSPNSVTVSGSLEALLHLKSQLHANGIVFKMLELDYAFHSPAMDKIKQQILTGLEDLAPGQATQLRFISSVDGCQLAGELLNAEYWWKNIRQPVGFCQAATSLIQDGVNLFIEIGPNPVLSGYLEHCLKEQNHLGAVIPTIKRDQESDLKIQNTLYTAQLLGAEVSTTEYFPRRGNFVNLPHYPWQRESFWLISSDPVLVERTIEHPLLGYRKSGSAWAWENSLDTQLMPWLADHEVGSSIVIPAAAYVEMALSAAKYFHGGDNLGFENLEILAPITLNHDELKVISSQISRANGNLTISTSVENGGHNTSCRLIELTAEWRSEHPFPDAEQADVQHTASDHYLLGSLVGLNYGPAFQTVEDVWIWRTGLSALAKLKLPLDLLADKAKYLLHPALLDGCFQLLLDIFSQRIKNGDLRALIPVRIGKLRLCQAAGEVSWCHVQVQRENLRSGVSNFILYNANREVVAILNDVRFRSVSFVQTPADSSAYVYRRKLQPLASQLVTAPAVNLDNICQLSTRELAQDDQNAQRSEHFNEVLPLFDILVTAYARKAFCQLLAGKTYFSTQQMVEDNLIVASQLSLANWLVSVLEQDEVILRLAESPHEYYFSPETIPKPELIWQTLLADYPQYLAELTQLAQVGSNLAAILSGNTQPMAILAPAKSSTLNHFYASSPSLNLLNQMLINSVQEISREWPENRRLRILELSNGSNALTKEILNILPLAVCDYLVLESDEETADNSNAIFADLANFSCVHLNVQKLAGQLPEDFCFNSYDLVIAANILHRVNDPLQTLATIRRCLVNSGILLIAERNSQRFSNLVYGIDPTWWLIDENLSIPASRLFPAESWQTLLAQNNFVNSVILREPLDQHAVNPYLLISQNQANFELAPLINWPESSDTANCLLLFDERSDNVELASALCQHLIGRGYQVIKVQINQFTQVISASHSASSFNTHGQLSAVLNDLPVIQAIFYLSGFTLDSEVVETERCWPLLQLIQGLESKIEQTKMQLWILSNHGAVFDSSSKKSEVPPRAHALGRDYRADLFLDPSTRVSSTLATTDEFKPAEGALWGLGRVIMNEYPSLSVKLLDMNDYMASENVAAAVFEEFLNNDPETEIISSPLLRRVLRMEERPLLVIASHELLSQPQAVLDFKVAGSLNNLYWRALTEQADLEADEIQIRPLAAGLNFRDVMYTMGMLSDEAVENGFAGASLGMELAGVVEKIGSGVNDFKVGDEVISFAPASFSTRVITKTTATALKPANWSNEAAASVPTAFFTVYYALHHLARLQPGERILIHGAAGGVGLAAIQYARSIGAEIYATAGTEEKRAFIKAMGVDHVMDSRSLAFSEEVMRLTSNQGVDVILNSLYGEAVWRNLAILRPFGRFLELGKRDFYANNQIGLRPFRNNISYFGIDADQLLIERKELAGKLFKEMMALFAAAELSPLPYRVFAAAQIGDAFRYMQQSRQIGKIIISFQGINDYLLKNQPLLATKPRGLSLDPHGSYLLSGGSSGFGLQAAKWLVEKGARCLILLSRNGVKDVQSAAIIRDMELQGVTIYQHLADVGNFKQVADLIEYVQTTLPPLKGVIHAAAIIEDAFIHKMKKPLFDKVLEAKARGAWNLHSLTESLNLDLFVVFSSITTYLGNPGQSNYVAANSYLESLTHYRRSQGLPSNYAAFGAISDAGFLTRNMAVKEALESRLGTKAMPAAAALAMLEKIILAGIAGAAIADFDWKIIQRFMPAAKSPKYAEQIAKARHLGGEHHGNEDIKDLIAGLPRAEAIGLIILLLAQQVGKILHIPPEKIDQHKSVFELGMDSLMGVELALSVEEHFAVKLPLMALAEGSTLAKLAVRIFDMSQSGALADKVDTTLDLAQSLASHHESDLNEFGIDNKQIEQLANNLQRNIG